jgi:hypothetical protein
LHTLRSEAPPEDTNEPVEQATEMRFAAAWLGQRVEDKVRENRLRRSAKQQGLTLVKFRSRESRAGGSGRYWLSPVDKDSGSWGSRLPACPDAGMTLDGVEEYLIYGTTRAEIMEYLSQAYGPVFVGDLLKHLPELRVEALNLHSNVAGSPLRHGTRSLSASLGGE